MILTINICFRDSTVGEKVIEQVRLETSLCRSSGHDNVDMTTAQDQDATVFNVSDYGSDTVVEYNFALLLNIAKRLDDDLGKTHNSESVFRASS